MEVTKAFQMKQGQHTHALTETVAVCENLQKTRPDGAPALRAIRSPEHKDNYQKGTKRALKQTS